jgi:GT2 family glycosyltransferase
VPRVSIVIPSWNQSGLLAGALRTLRTQTFRDFEVVVADNGSTDDTAAMLARDFPEVRVLPLGQNLGFARATNLGLQAARGEILVCLNNDIECEPGWLAALVDALDRMPEVGSVASKMMDAKRPGIIDAAGDVMSLVAWNAGRGMPDGPAYRSGREILSACAGAAAYRRTLFETVGWFDEAYFAWFEDVDLGIRAQLAGFRCWYEPSAVVHHLGSATAMLMNDRKAFLTSRNSMRLFFKTMPLRRLIPWGPLVLLWPWVNPLMTGRPLRPTLRAWLAFWPMLPATLRARRDVYARRRVPVSRLTRLLDSPADDIGRALLAIWRRLSAALTPARAAA